MRKRIIVLLLSATAASSLGASAQDPQAGPPAVNGAATSPHSTSAVATMLSVRGTIDTYDVPTRTLSLSTTTGAVRLPLSPQTRIRQGWHKVDPVELPKLTGNRATVRYTESGGRKVVESVHVFGKTP